jgi:hypothetical protein
MRKVMEKKIPRADSKRFLKENSIDTSNCKVTTSRMWERKDDNRYLDNWWFKFDKSDLHNHQHIIFCGALDYKNKEFRVLKIPSEYFIDNLSKLDISIGSWVNVYLSFNNLVDLRSKSRLPFKQFLVN